MSSTPVSSRTCSGAWSYSVWDGGLRIWTSCGSICPFLQPVKVPLSSSPASSILTTPCNLLSPVHLLTAHFCLTVHVLKEMLNSTDSSKSPRGMPLVTACQLDFGAVITTLYVWQSSWFPTHLIADLPSLDFSSLALRILWETMSKASLKSR